MNNFSPNMLKSFEDCPKKFFFKYVKKLSIPQPSEFFETGKKIHALASYFLQGEDISRMEDALAPAEVGVWAKLKQNKYFSYQLIKSEYSLSSKIVCEETFWWVGGRLDAVVKDGESNFYILDYKTGKIPKNPEFDFQTVVYLLSLEKHLLKNKTAHKSINFVYLGLKNDEEFVVVLTKELRAKYEKHLCEILDKIDVAQSSKNYAQNTKLCEKCEYNELCSVGF